MPITLEQLIESLNNYNVKTLTKSSIKEISAKLGMDEKKVEAELKQAGIQRFSGGIEEENYPLPDQDCLHDIDEALTAINKWVSNPNLINSNERAGLGQAKNVYDYVAYFSVLQKKPGISKDELFKAVKEEAEKWRAGQEKGYSNENLLSFVTELGKAHQQNIKPFTWYKTIETQAKTKLFAINDKLPKNDLQKPITRKRYDFYLCLKEKKILDDLRFFGESLPEKLLQSTAFVTRITDSILKASQDIEEFQCSDRQCVDIYNRTVFQIPSQYYEEAEPIVTVFCPQCGKPYRNSNYSDLQSKSCEDCEVPLFRKCPKCNKSMPAYMKYCPNAKCNFFIPGVELFDTYKEQFNDAIQRNSFHEARAALNAAQKAKPYATNELKQMESQLNRLEETVGMYFKKLDGLISEGKYHAAQLELPKIREKVPNIDLSEYEKNIKSTLDWALAEGSKLSKDSESAGVQRCLAILSRVKDDSIAANWLESHKPLPVKNVNVNVNGADKTCTLTWADTDNVSVSYTIMRGEGHAPLGLGDGVQVAKNITSLSFTDSKLKPGIAYFYTVFTVRGTSAIGEKCTRPAVMFEELSENDVIIHVEDESCKLSWKLPPRCVGVRVIRREEDSDSSDRPVDVKNSTYTDQTVCLGERYVYLLKTIWEIDNTKVYSNGITVKAVIQSRPNPIELSCQMQDQVAFLSWEKPKQDHDVLILKINQGAFFEKDNLYSPEEYKKIGKVLATVPAKNGSYELRVQPGEYLRIAAFSLYNGNAIAGSSVTVSTLKPIQVNREKTDVLGGHLHMEFGPLPKDVIKIGVAILEPGKPFTPSGTQTVETADGTFNPADGNIAYLYSVKEYLKNTYLSLKNLNFSQPFDAYIYGIYQTDAGEAESEGVRLENLNQKKTTLTCKVLWGGFRGTKRKGACLMVSSDSGRMPTSATLVCAPNGELPRKWEINLIRLAQVTEKTEDGKLIKLDEGEMAKAPANAKLNLLLEEGLEKQFTVKFDTKNFTMPK